MREPYSEIILGIATSSAFILAIVLLRALFHKKISMRLQYALWLFVALKLLLVPVPQFESVLSVQRLTGQWEGNQMAESKDLPLEKDVQQAVDDGWQQKSAVQQADSEQIQSSRDQNKKDHNKAKSNLSFKETEKMWLCTWIAGIGSAMLFLYFFTGNLKFARYLRTKRVRFQQDGNPLPVYLVKGLPSPCLYVRAVYLTPELAADPKRLSYVLAHEYCHYRQGDTVWSILRAVCVMLYWWNPLVWLAAYLSKQDCELACDERAMAYWGQEERISYGKTLLSLVAVKPARKQHSFFTTMMIGGGHNMKHRIQRIAKKQKIALSGCILVVILSVLCFVSVSTTNPAKGTSRQEPTEKIEIPDVQREFTLSESVSKDQDTAAADKTNLDPSDVNQVTFNHADLDQAVGQAILSESKGRYSSGECVAEGHKILGQEEADGLLTVYVLTMYGEYAFQNGWFIKDSGSGTIPAVIKFSGDKRHGYVLEDMEWPKEGGYYLPSIREMFPESLQEVCISVNEEISEELSRQEAAYAEAYLKKINRKAPIGEYSDVEHKLLTEAGVSVKVSNRLGDTTKVLEYPYFIGSLEKIENGVRYVYETKTDEEAREIIYTKTEYDTGTILEEFRFDMDTGAEIK